MRTNLFYTLLCTIVLCACNNDDGWRVLGEKDETTLYVESILESKTTDDDLKLLNETIGTTTFYQIEQFGYITNEERWAAADNDIRELQRGLYFEQDICYLYYWIGIDGIREYDAEGNEYYPRILRCEKYEYTINTSEEGILLEFKANNSKVDTFSARLISIDENQVMFAGTMPMHDLPNASELRFYVCVFEFNDTIRAEWDSILAKQETEE